jgi:hypothetical protein
MIPVGQKILYSLEMVAQLIVHVTVDKPVVLGVRIVAQPPLVVMVVSMGKDIAPHVQLGGGNHVCR